MNHIPPQVSIYKDAYDNEGQIIDVEKVIGRIQQDQYLIDTTAVYRENYLPPVKKAELIFEVVKKRLADKWKWIQENRELKRKSKANTAPYQKALEVEQLQASDPDCMNILEAEAVYNGKSEKADKFKTSYFPAITWAGILNKRNKKSLAKHSGLIVIDIDDLPKERHDALKMALREDPYIYLMFTSPSGEGLKPVIKIPADESTHLEYLNSIFIYLSETYGIRYGKGQELDPSGKDVSRLCFICYDPDCFVNRDSLVFDRLTDSKPVNEKAKQKPSIHRPSAGEPVIPSGTAKDIWAFTENVEQYVDKNRNNFLYKFACNCVRTGIEMSDCFEEAKESAIGLPETEIAATVQSAYNNDEGKPEEAKEFGMFAKRKPSQKPGTGDRSTNTGTEAPAKSPTGQVTYSQESYPLYPDDGQAEQSVGRSAILEDGIFTKFWDFKRRQNKQGHEQVTFEVDYNALKLFLSENGFFRLPTDKQNYQFIKITNNRVSPVSILNIKDFIFDWLEDRGEYEVTNALTKGGKQFLSLDKIERIPFRKVEVKKHTANEAFFYYQNGMVVVTKDDIKLIPYDKMEDSFIWESSVNERSVTIIPDENPEDATAFTKELKNSEIYRFFWLACCNDKNLDTTATKAEKDQWDEDHITKFVAHCTAIGYLLHRYKTPSKARAIIAIDHQIPTDLGEQNGGTGKSIVGNYVLRNITKVAVIPGKDYKDENQWRFEPITIDTQIVFFNDVKRNFNFEGIFEMVTDDMNINRRNIGYLNIPFDDSAKIFLASNFIPKGDGSSFKRRTEVIEFDNYFNENYSPYDEFGHNLFQDWKGEFAGEWNLYDNFIFRIVQMYLQEGLVSYPKGNYHARKLMSECPQEFIDWMDAANERGQHLHVERSKWIIRKDMFTKWATEAKSYNLHTPTPNAFSKMLKKYCQTRSVEFNSRKTAGVEYYCFGVPPTYSPTSTQTSLM